jgi:sterol desaturase/sphingolipid hydroxylase (fatty acid hydroxylase superfamily)
MFRDMEDWSLEKISVAIVAITILRYAVLAGLAWALGYVWFRRSWVRRKIISAFPEGSQIRREALHSLRSAVIFGVVGTLTVFAVRQGWTRMYFSTGDYPAMWFWFSILLTILLHDTWFYWTHRLMHHPGLFRAVHRDHHLSRNPTPWAAFAFSPMEAAVQAMIFPLAVFLFPLHPLAFGMFMMWQMFFNVIGHTGYEYNRPGFMKSWIRFLINTPTNHIMHHEFLKGNYGLYFNFWDRIMKTNHPDYEKRFLQVTAATESDAPRNAG